MSLVGLMVAGALGALALGTSLVFDFLLNDKLDSVQETTRVIERTVSPVCVTPGREADCNQLLIAADESRVANLCRRTAAVLRLSGIDARCVIPAGSVGRDEGTSGAGGPAEGVPSGTASFGLTTPAAGAAPPGTAAGGGGPGNGAGGGQGGSGGGGAGHGGGGGNGAANGGQGGSGAAGGQGGTGGAGGDGGQQQPGLTLPCVDLNLLKVGCQQ